MNMPQSLDPAIPNQPVLDKKIKNAMAVLLGLLVGDIMGATTEFTPIVSPKELDQSLADLRAQKPHFQCVNQSVNGWVDAGDHTDDSSMMLCCIRAYMFCYEKQIGR